MTVRTAALQTCDRCLKPFSEKHLSVGDKVPIFKQKGLIITQTTGTNLEAEPKYKVLLAFDDLCPDCEKTVMNLLDRMKLDGNAGTTKRAPAKKRGSRKKKAAPEPVKEYKEEPKTESKTESKSNGKSNGSSQVSVTEEKVKEQPTPAEAVEAKTPETKEETVEEAPLVEEPLEAQEATSKTQEEEAVELKLDETIHKKDPVTGDVYDMNTGEVVMKGTSDAHPF